MRNVRSTLIPLDTLIPESEDSILSWVRCFALQLEHWDLDNDCFPDVLSEVALSWTPPYGGEVVYAYLSAVADVRSGRYWEVSPLTMSRAEEKRAHASIRLRGLISDLRGDGLLPRQEGVPSCRTSIP